MGGLLFAKSIAATPATVPGGADTQIQFNDAGIFGGQAGLTWDKVSRMSVYEVTIQPPANAVDTLLIKQSGGPTVLAVDTLNVRVGVGTASPGYALDLRAGTENFIINGESTDAGAYIRLKDNNANGWYFGASAGTFFLVNTGNVTRFAVLNSGNVGIGTNIPSDLLHVSAFSVNATGITIENTNGGLHSYAQFKLLTDGGDIHRGGCLKNSSTQTAYGGAYAMLFYQFGAHPISFVTNNRLSPDMIVTGGGLVGINQVTPGAQLQIDTNATTTIGQIIKGAPAQSANLQEWQASTGTVDLKVGPDGELSFAVATELTIAGGVITALKSYHKVDTDGSSPDDLDTILGGVEGDLLVIRPESAIRTVIAKDGAGNLQLAGGDFTMDDVADTLILIYDGSNWLELSRSNNA